MRVDARLDDERAEKLRQLQSLARLSLIRELMERCASLPMDLADASLVVAATELGDGRILSTAQRDFDTYRWKDTQPFHNLLRPFAAEAEWADRDAGRASLRPYPRFAANQV